MKMSDRKTYSQRLEGMEYALRVANKYGVKALENEVKVRGAHFIPLEVSREATGQITAFLADRILQTFQATTLYTLCEEFGFGKKRLERFSDAFGYYCDMVSDLNPFGGHYAKISDYADYLNQKYGIGFNLETILQVEKENQGENERMACVDYVLGFLRDHGFPEAAECMEQYL